jgi:hypothetical protein
MTMHNGMTMTEIVGELCASADEGRADLPFPIHADGSFGLRRGGPFKTTAENTQAFLLSATTHAIAGTVPASMEAAREATTWKFHDNSEEKGMSTATTAKNVQKRAQQVAKGPKTGRYPVLGTWMSVLNKGLKALKPSARKQRAKPDPTPAKTETAAPAPAAEFNSELFATLIANGVTPDEACRAAQS